MQSHVGTPVSCWGSGVGLVTLVLALLLAPVAHAERRIEGVAYPLKGGAPIYRETHFLYADAGVPSRLVLYRCPDGRPFARKRLREQPSATAPEFEFVDARTGYRESVGVGGRTRQVTWQASGTARPQRKPVALAANAVVDAGFDAFVRQHWAELGQDRGQVVPFLIPSHFGTLDFRIGNARDGVDRGRGVRTLRMSLASVFGALLPDIDLTYTTDDHRLLRFKGPTTIRDARGRMQGARVEFPDAPVEAGVTRAAIDAAAATPLVTRCGA